MPSSEPTNIPMILEYLRKKRNIKSILDVGIGCGKYGLLFREYLDGHWVSNAFHDPSTWKINLVGVEAFSDYLTPVHRYIYSKLIVADFYDHLEKFEDTFDVIFMGDVLEHFDKFQIPTILRGCSALLNPGGSLIISTPNFETNLSPDNPGVFGNKYDTHKCRVYKKDLTCRGLRIVKSDESRLLTVFMEKA